jgi:hypothetical protein
MYHVIIMYNIKSNEQQIVHYFIWYVSNDVYYLINVKSFYLSTLTSRLFRTTFFKSLFQLLPYCQQRQNKTQLSENLGNNSSRNKSDTKS